MTFPIEIDKLSKVYRGKKQLRVEALRELSFSIPVGEVFGFLGPNGAGKSTTIKILMGLIAPTGGTARLFGTPVTEAAARRSVGYLPENPAFYDFLTAREYLAFVGTSFGMDARTITAKTDEVLDRLDLREAADRPMRSYSKGMVQRLGIAQTLLHDPDLYILDEPMSGLDPIGRALVKDVIKGLKERGKTVFFSTHITADVEAVCDRLGVIVKGRLEALDRVEHVLRSGIEGYTVEVSGGPGAGYDEFTCLSTKGDVREYYVPAERFNAFAGVV
ncbi:MAG TPA: ABC transporter ATP-binding protein, partial [Geobacteraceae bacterium]